MIVGSSLERLKTCHPDLQKIVHATDRTMGLSVLCGYRNGLEQEVAFRSGASKLTFPNSKHNHNPSLAVDIIPYFVLGKQHYDWNDKLAFARLAGVMFAKAHDMGVKLRWGGDWDMDGRSADQTFNDLPHFELIRM